MRIFMRAHFISEAKPASQISADPASYATGQTIASYSTPSHSVLNVQAPNQGVVGASVELTQLNTSPFVRGGRRFSVGQPGLPLLLAANGSGTRTQLGPLRSFFLGGNAVVVDS
jgi:hypothetical protein